MKIMKKQSIYALMSAIALAGAVGLSACSSSKDDVGEVSPNFNPNTNEALVEFVFNVAPGANHATTRQTAYATQAYALNNMTTDNFRGIEDAHVMCFTGGTDGTYLTASTTAAKDFDMARVAASNSLSSEKSTRVLEMSLPINSNQMVFYGRAITNQNETDYKNKYGHLDDGTNGYNIPTDLSATYFKLSKRLTDTDKVKLQEIERLLAGILTCIMETNRGSDNLSVNGFDLTDYHHNIKWSAYNTIDEDYPEGKSLDNENETLKPLEIKLAKVYKEMTTIQEAELRNGSAPALLATITDLWTVVNGVRCATPTNKQEALAKYMAGRIHAEITRYFKADISDDGGPAVNVKFNTGEEYVTNINNLITQLTDDNYWPVSDATPKPVATNFTNITAYSKDDLAVFPEKFDLPQGATHLKFNNTGSPIDIAEGFAYKAPNNGFYYAVNFNSSAAGGGAFTVDDYYYPAELLYFGNSPLRVSDATYKASEYPQTTASWNATDGTFWTTPKDGHSWVWGNGSHVKTSTRSVAMANDINYGTALLEMTVGYKDNVTATPLQDNNAFIQNRDYGVAESNNTITPTDGSFKLVGVLIGGQYPKVGWNFLPTGNEKQGYIYDKDIADGSIPQSGNTAANYTLVFDNYNSDQADNAQNVVYVALELENNTGSGFFGKDNLIPNGSHFYLIGALDPNTKSAPKLTAYHALPPYKNHAQEELKYDPTKAADAEDQVKTIPRVFIQDHKTTVNFKIGQYSLQYAYLNIPDLRSSSVTLGLSVDLSWSTGINFGEVVIGGNDDQNPNP